MTTRAQLYIASYTASAMMLLNVFSKPLHIPEPIQWVLILGVFIPLGWLFYLIKKDKREKLQQSQHPLPTESTKSSIINERQNTKKKLVLMMVLGSTVGLCAPLWIPLTGTTLGATGDFICGAITAVVICVIYGVRLRNT